MCATIDTLYYITIECLWCYKHMYVHTPTHTHPYTHTHTHTHVTMVHCGINTFLCTYIDSEMVIHVQHLYIHPTHMYSRTSTFVQFLHVVPTVATALTESISVLSWRNPSPMPSVVFLPPLDVVESKVMSVIAAKVSLMVFRSSFKEPSFR